LRAHVTDGVDVGVGLASLQQLRGLNDRTECLLNACILQPVVTQPLLQVTQVVSAHRVITNGQFTPTTLTHHNSLNIVVS